ncbi:MAG: hypothetical protein WDZ51_01320 [Pirellulaceae bacterium]
MPGFNKLGFALLVASICLTGIGCGGEMGLITVTGKVVENGQPIDVPDYEEGVNNLRVIFVQLDESGSAIEQAAQMANVRQDGTFTMVGNLGGGIEPGSYRVGIQNIGTGGDGSEGVDLWDGKHGPSSSTFVYEISGSNKDLTIDLADAPAAP